MLNKGMVGNLMRSPSTVAYIGHVVRTNIKGATPLTYKQFMRIVWEMHVNRNKG